MVEPGECFSFALEAAFHRSVAVQVGPDQFHRYGTVKGEVGGPVHHAHAALARPNGAVEAVLLPNEAGGVVHWLLLL